MRLVIAEKPSVAKSLAAVLGATSRKDGYLEGGGWLVSWCLGHLAGLADAAAYNPDYAKWRYDDLPILPETWRFTIATTTPTTPSGAMMTCPFCRSPGASPSPRTSGISSTCYGPCCGGRT